MKPVPATLGFLTALLLLGGCSDSGPVGPAPPAGSAWTRLTGGITSSPLISVWQSPASRIYVGVYEGLLVFDGAEWSLSRFPYGGTAYRITGTSDRNVFAVLLNGVVHFDGDAWTYELNAQAQNIWCGGDVEAIAVGRAIYWRKHGVWEETESPTSSWLMAVWGTSSQNIFVVGTDGRVIHFDGETWSVVLSDVERDLLAINGTSGSDVIAAGDGVITHFDGIKWSRVDVSGVSTSWRSVFEHEGLLYVAGTNGRLLRFRGSRWQEVSGLPADVRDVSAGMHDVPVAVAGPDGQVYWMDDDRWRPMLKDPGKSYRTVWALGGQQAMVGGSASGSDEAVLWSGRGTARTFETPGYVQDLWADAPDNVYALIGYKPCRFDGTRWTDLGDPGMESPITIAGFRDGRVAVAGYDSLVASFDGSAWSGEPLNGGHFAYDLWGVGITGMLAGTDDGIAIFDGTSWRPWAYRGTPCRRVSASSLSNVWALLPTQVTQYDGSRWVDRSVPEIYPLAISVHGVNDVYLTGYDNRAHAGHIMRWDGQSWEEDVLPAAPVFNDISISPSGSDVWAVGEAGAIFHLDRR